MSEKALIEKAQKEISEDLPCIFGEEIRQVCPVLKKMAEKDISDYITPALPSSMQSFPIDFAELTKGIKQMTASILSKYDRIIGFCNNCPYPPLYIMKQEYSLEKEKE